MKEEQMNFNPAQPKQRANFMLTNFVSNFDDLGRNRIESMIRNVENVDLLENSENKSLFQKIAYYLNMSNPIEWLFLAFFSLIISVILLIYNGIINISYQKRIDICSSDSSVFNFFFWFFSGIVLLLTSSAVGYFISEDAEGSGIPEMKTVLSGITLSNYFTFNALVAKLIGLFTAIIGGIV
jgi:H+/Cl- antiporter ClcA